MLALATLLLLTAPTAEAKGKPGRKSKKTEAAAEKADTTKKEKKGYEELLKGAVTDKGMFDVHRKGTDFLFEIPDSLMGRDILIVNKISGVPYALNDAGVNKGMGYGEKIVRFRKDTLYKKVWVMTYDPRITSPEGDRITRSVRDNYRETAIEQFPIDAYGKDSASVVIKVNKVFDGSEKSFNNVFGSIGLPGSPKKDLSKIESVKSFPENIIVKSLLSTSHTEEGTTIPLTVEITSNLVLLAREPMRPRFSDDRVGYFEIGHLYFNDEQQKAEDRAFMYRQIRAFRETKPIFTMDFWNDGEFTQGCIAGGRRYLHINAAGDVEPCVFAHYANANIRDVSLLDALRSPIFMAYYEQQPFNDNYLRPCPTLDNAGILADMVDRTGAHSTDLQHAEDAHDLCAKCAPAAEEWAPVAERLWTDPDDPLYQKRQDPGQGLGDTDKSKLERLGRGHQPLAPTQP